MKTGLFYAALKPLLLDTGPIIIAASLLGAGAMYLVDNQPAGEKKHARISDSELSLLMSTIDEELATVKIEMDRLHAENEKLNRAIDRLTEKSSLEYELDRSNTDEKHLKEDIATLKDLESRYRNLLDSVYELEITNDMAITRRRSGHSIAELQDSDSKTHAGEEGLRNEIKRLASQIQTLEEEVRNINELKESHSGLTARLNATLQELNYTTHQLKDYKEIFKALVGMFQSSQHRQRHASAPLLLPPPQRPLLAIENGKVKMGGREKIPKGKKGKKKAKK